MKIRNPHSAFRNNAFTLVELLIVIGIIAILIGILIPVVSGARKTAYATSSRNQIQVLGAAIDRYYTDFGAYPGVLPASALLGGSAPVTVAGAASAITSSENLFLALCGGLTAGPTYTSTDVGRGPLTFNALQSKRLSAYTDATPAAASILLDIHGVVAGNADHTASWSTAGTWCSIVPEFMDQYPQAMPIIYMRAKVGAAVAGGNIVGATDAAGLQYNLTDLTNYLGAGAVPSAPFTSWNNYFANTSMTNVAMRMDTYMLISPGADRVYGTSDDICNFSH